MVAEEGSRRCLSLWGLIPILEGHCTLISSYLFGVGDGVMINVPDPATITDSCASEVNGIISEQGMIMTQVMSRRRPNPELRAR